MARIVEHLSVAELEGRYRAARDATEARHAQAIWLLAQGRDVLDAAGVLAFAPRWVAALGGGVGRTLQRARPRGAGRPAAAQRARGQRADPGSAGRGVRAVARAAR